MVFRKEWMPFIAIVAVDFATAIVNILLKKILDEGVSHLLVITYRQSIGAVFLFPIAYFWEREGRDKLNARTLCHLFFSALLGATLSPAFFLLGLKYTSSTYTTGFSNLVPVFTFVMAVPFGLEKVSIKSKGGRAKVLGAVVSTGGALILTLYKGVLLTGRSSEPQATIHQASKRWAIGSVALVGSCLLWSSWFLIQAGIGKKYPFQYSSTAIMSFFSAIQAAILCLIFDKNASWMITGWSDISSLVYSGIVGTGLCFVGMAWCVKQRGPVFTAAFIPSIQVFVAIFAVSFLHEQIHLGSVLGSAVVVIGMYVLLWGKSYEAKKSDDVTKLAPVMEEDEIQCQLSTMIPVGASTLNST